MSRINYLLNKFAQGTCSSDEFEELMDLLQEPTLDQELKNALRGIQESLDREIISESTINQHGDIVQRELKSSNRVKKTFSRRSVAAAIIVIIGVPALLLLLFRAFNGERSLTQKSIVSTPAGSKTSVELPDGSKVWLNAKSTLTYTTGFVDGKREVSLVGEAMFDIKHDSLHPFFVHTENFDVTDLGTVFNIRAYPEDKNSEAALISGSIEISLKKKSADKILLEPNQKMVLEKIEDNSKGKGKDITSSVVPILADPQTQIVPDTSWMVNKLIFKDETFEDLAMKLQRRYNVEIQFEELDYGNYKFTGRFEDETIDEALQELQIIAPFSYRKNGNRIVITK